jgi:multiple sugar transport system permease protein
MNQSKTGPVAAATKTLLTLMYGVPILWILLTSFKSPADVFDRGATFLFRPTLSAYVANIDPTLWQALGQSVTIAVCSTALVLLIATPAAYGLARTRGWLPTLGLALLIVLQMLPQTANVIPLFQIFSSWRILDTTMAVVLADTALLAPFATLLLRPFFRAVRACCARSGASSSRWPATACSRSGP